MTQIEVCNLALGWIGSELITSINDAATPAHLLKANWGPTRDVVLESREWSFAVKRTVLAADSIAPAFGWERRFPIPSNVLRVLRCVDAYGEQVDWQREGAFIVSDEATIFMVALVRVETTADLPASFAHALAARLAADLAVPVAQSETLQMNMWKLYGAKLKEAATLDSMQGRSVQTRGPRMSRFR